MDLLSRRSRTGWSLAVTGGILALCVGAGALGQDRIWTGALSAAHDSPAFRKQAQLASGEAACSACHAAGRAPDRMCLRCHEDRKAIDAHRGIDKPAGIRGRQSVRSAWLGHPHVPLACSSCHREHEEDGALLKQVANTLCEACHPSQHETRQSRSQRKSFLLAQGGPKAVKEFDGVVLETWSRRCVTCHHEHDDYSADEGEMKE
jgi:predicted CXXCH cytochrome family protein